MSKLRYNPKTGNKESYLTLKESFRDKAGGVHTRTVQTAGFLPGVCPEDIGGIAKAVTRI